MESQKPMPSGADDRTPDGARAALDALATDRGALADRVRAPRWYYPALGGIVAVFIASPAAADTSAQSQMVALGAVALVFLMLAHKRVTGFTITRDAGPRSLVRAIVLGVVVVALFVCSMILVATGNAPWVAAAAVAAFAAVVVGGRAYDRAYDEELRRGR